MLCSAPEVVTVSAAYFMLSDCLAYCSTLRIEAGHFSDISVNFYHTTWCHIPQDGLIVHLVLDSRTLQTSSTANTSCKYLIHQSLHEYCSLCPWQIPSREVIWCHGVHRNESPTCCIPCSVCCNIFSCFSFWSSSVLRSDLTRSTSFLYASNWHRKLSFSSWK